MGMDDMAGLGGAMDFEKMMADIKSHQQNDPVRKLSTFSVKRVI